jgi:predicted O-methyltransferase YrrM
MDHIDLIEVIFLACGYKDYLELGIWNGVNLARMAKHARYAVGVDIVDIRVDRSTTLFVGVTDDFFKCNTSSFDLIFIDANHNYEHVQNDLIQSLNTLTPRGTIILHDTDPKNATLLGEGYCSTAYKIRQDLRANDQVDFVTLPMNEAGLTIVKPRNSERHLEFV